MCQELKKCVKCGETKTVDNFFKNGNFTRTDCKVCTKKYSEKRRSNFTKEDFERLAKIQSKNHQATKVQKEIKRKLDKINNPGKYKNQNLKRYFGITLDDYNKIWEEQAGVCKICKKPETSVEKRSGKVKMLSVDHCHVSGKIRGLLCQKCNTGIGMFGDELDLLKSAVEYLQHDV